MAESDGKRTNVRKKSHKLEYFYLDGKLVDNGPTIPLLYRRLHINRGKDTIITWCYPLAKRVAFTYSDVKKKHAPAFTTQQVATMLCRSRETVERAILRGDIEAPQFTYGLTALRQKYKYLWHEADIMQAHAYFSSVHRGRPRKDGKITPAYLPTARELRAMIRQEQILYIQNDKGDFVPVWRAEDFT